MNADMKRLVDAARDARWRVTHTTPHNDPTPDMIKAVLTEMRTMKKELEREHGKADEPGFGYMDEIVRDALA